MYSSAKSFYAVAVQINPTLISNSFCEFFKRSKNRTKRNKLLNLMSCWVKSMKNDSKLCASRLHGFGQIFLHGADQKIDKWKKNKKRKSSTKTCTPYFAVQKLARFRGYRVNERRIHTVFVRSKICPERCKRGVSVTLYETRNSGLHVDVKWSSFAIGQNTWKQITT